MDCAACGSAGVTERPDRTTQGYRRFRCCDCGKQYNERSGTLLNHAQYPSDVIGVVMLWRLRYRLTGRVPQRGVGALLSGGLCRGVRQLHRAG